MEFEEITEETYPHPPIVTDVSSHPTNGTIITYDDGRQTIYTATGEVKKNEPEES